MIPKERTDNQRRVFIDTVYMHRSRPVRARGLKQGCQPG